MERACIQTALVSRPPRHTSKGYNLHQIVMLCRARFLLSSFAVGVGM
jgi:hypothetical protein